jgi:ribosomal protein S12 methylthiotransferase accessory factor
MGAADATLRAGWMVGAVSAGIVIVGPTFEVDVAVADGPAAMRVLTGDGTDEHADAGADGRQLTELLSDLDALETDPAPAPPPPGCSLADAIAATLRDAPPAGVIWTADEALVLPPGLSVALRTRALWTFVGGLAPDPRLEAYAALVQGRGRVLGDVPDPALLDQRLADADVIARIDGPIVALELHGARRIWRTAPAALDQIGAGAPHRLGPVLHTSPPEPVVDELPDLLLCVGEIAVADPAAPTPRAHRTVQGVGDAAQAQLIACAEGAERFAASETRAAGLVRARETELLGAVAPSTLYAGEVPAADADEPRLWAPVATLDGRRRWVPAETVHLALPDPAPNGALLPWTSSGLAAGRDVADARRRAFRELVERDAFMLTWLHRTSRERISARGVPAAATEMARVLRAHGWQTAWVNLTRDTHAVILCCLTHDDEGLTVGAACDRDAAAALCRATVEALVLALRFQAPEGPRPEPRAVRSPRDHLLLHRDPSRHPDHGFLYASTDELELADVPRPESDDLEAQLEALGHSPLIADLSTERCAPYAVVRALAPGLVPLTFGWGQEALGLPRVRNETRTQVGHRADPPPHTTAAIDRVPHPFP